MQTSAAITVRLVRNQQQKRKTLRRFGGLRYHRDTVSSENDGSFSPHDLP
jgi:hypothetical protein